MFVEERHALIIQELKENGRVKVKGLSAKFKVSEDLIRKDLALLAQQGKLKKHMVGLY
ncbi:Transcriptional regulators of sugar metabolism [Megamonas hypermegale ART12/1]|nr:Transcriptional regulators of sugar metabolism [Megamonas hypermegale ART12/1]